jgi:hypothetical protein
VCSFGWILASGTGRGIEKFPTCPAPGCGAKFEEPLGWFQDNPTSTLLFGVTARTLAGDRGHRPSWNGRLGFICTHFKFFSKEVHMSAAQIFSESEVLTNQKRILDNQATLLKNQDVIKNNQNDIKRNQEKLDVIVKNQEKILTFLKK